MELGALLTTLSKTSVEKVLLEQEDITELLDFFLEYNIDFSTLYDHEDDLNSIVRSIRKDTDEQATEHREWLTHIEDDYAIAMNQEIYTQDFKTDNSKVIILLND